MSRRAAILVVAIVVVLLAATAGCIEVKEKPPQGPFTIDLVSEEMYFVAETGSHLEGPHAHVETEIAHAHEEYAWDIEDLGEFEGAEVELPAHDVGVRKASYNVHFIDQENDTGCAVATLPDLSGSYFVIGDGIGLEEGDEDTQTLDLAIGPSPNLTHVSSGEGWKILEHPGRLDEPVQVGINHHARNEGNVTYLVGVRHMSGGLPEEYTGSIRIAPGQYHLLTFANGELRLSIWKSISDVPLEEPVYNGTYEDLPSEYRTHIGHLEWEGHVGEVEETPGFGALLSMAAVAVVVVIVVHRR